MGYDLKLFEQCALAHAAFAGHGEHHIVGHFANEIIREFAELIGAANKIFFAALFSDRFP
jgi:hypothetical protein